MRTTLLNIGLALLLIAGVVIAPYIASPTVKAPLERAWVAGNEGNYEVMARNLKQVLATQAAPGVLHNLGNAEYQLGNLGEAILAWEQARALNPYFRNTIANLRFARGKAGLEQPEASWHEVYSAVFSPDVWLWIASCAFWLGIGFLAAPYILKRRRTAWTQGGAVAAIGIFLLTLPAIAGIVARSKIGVVLGPETVLRLTPTKEGEMLGKLSEGELARIEKTRGKYLYVRASVDRAGWIRSEEFGRIWP